MANPSPTDIYIALMGVTGVGKSAFISHCTDQTAVVGDGLQSCWLPLPVVFPLLLRY